MAKVIGFEPRVMLMCTCDDCAAIVEYASNERKYLIWEDGRIATDEGSKIEGITCPNCNEFIRLSY